jgi:uncharacterized protein (TIGR04141 family)
VRSELANDPLRWVTWSFGTGHRCLRRHATEPRFGLLAALNTISGTGSDASAARLREVRFLVTAPYIQHGGHRASRGIPVEGFRIDPRSDLVSEARGIDPQGSLGDVFGGRSLRLQMTSAT